MSKGFLMVLSGPSGSGKGTVSAALMKKNKEIVFSTSVTTRTPRPGEVNGENYFFVSVEEFENMVQNDGLLEYAFVHTNYYGTPKDFVFEEIEKGEIVLLEIDVQGALQIKKRYKEAVFIFLLPPSMSELKQRLINRDTETEEEINTRFSNAYKELDFVGEYDFFVVNNTVEQAVTDIEHIIAAEKLRTKRFKNIKAEVLKKVTDSRYKLVMLVSKRARKIVEGSEPLEETDLQKPVSIALDEVVKGDIVYGPAMTDDQYDEYIEEQKNEKLNILKEEILKEIKLSTVEEPEASEEAEEE